MEAVNKENKQRKICLILLSVIFLLMSFSLTISYYFVFILSLLALGILIYLSYPNLKRFDWISILIYLIPLLALGIFYAIGNFSRYYSDIFTRILIPITMIVFGFSGILMFSIPKFEIKWIFRGIFVGLALISLINMISTLYNFGPFHGIIYQDYYSYYDGTISKDTVSNLAYALNGFTIKQVPINYYLIFPILSLGNVIFLLMNRKNKVDLIISIISLSIALISIIFVISRVTVVFSVLSILFVCVLSVLFFIKKRPSKHALKFVSYMMFLLVGAWFILALINAQRAMFGGNNLFSNVGFLNYIFNTNRFSSGVNLVLNSVFSPSKLIGFPVLFDELYDSNVFPSNNIFVNQFMYGGVFGFLFFAIISIMLVFNFLKVRNKPFEDLTNKYMPFIFIALFFIYSFVGDVNNIEDYKFISFVYTPLNPFFLMSIMFGGYYLSVSALRSKKDE